MIPVYVAAGSNVDARRNLKRALEELRRSFPNLRSSPAYRNRAVGFEGEDFINLAVGFETDKSLTGVIEELRRIEAICGRPRNAPKWAPRSMDLDILMYGDATIDSAEAVLPRPDLLKRAYMLGPLAQLAPQLRHPQLQRPMADLWQEFDRDAHQLSAIDL